MIKFVSILIAVFCMMAEMASAQIYKRPDDMEYFKEKKVPTEINPDTGYVFVRLSKTEKRWMAAPTLIRQLSDSETAAYDVVKQEKFAKAKAKNDAKRTKRLKQKSEAEESGVPFTKSIPPVLTYDQFVFEYEDIRNVYLVEPRKEYRKTDFGRDMFFSLNPGNYVLYNVSGVCMCLGTVQFEVKAGEITDMGAIVSDFVDRDGAVSPYEEIEAVTKGHGIYKTGFAYSASAVRPHTGDMEVPAELASFKRVGADYRAKGKMPMYFSTMLDRLPAIPGVLSYRDSGEVVDARTGQVLN